MLRASARVHFLVLLACVAPGIGRTVIGHFDEALTDFQADVHSGKANVRVVARDATTAGRGGGGAIGGFDVLALLVLAGAVAAKRPRSGAVTLGSPVTSRPGDRASPVSESVPAS